MANESVMWEHFRAKVEGSLGVERIDAKRVEGVPDVVWCHGPTDKAGWIELKVIDKPFVRGSLRIPWKSPAQPLWLGNWARRGGRAGILLRDAEDSWWYWEAQPDAAWHKAMLSKDLPKPTWWSRVIFDARDFVYKLTR